MSLSKSELIILIKTLKGLRSNEMASSLFVEAKTVKFHLTNIYKKLNIKNGRFELITKYNNLLDVMDDKNMSFDLPSGNINKAEMNYDNNYEKIIFKNIEILDTFIKSLISKEPNSENLKMLCECMKTQKELIKAMEGE